MIHIFCYNKFTVKEPSNNNIDTTYLICYTGNMRDVDETALKMRIETMMPTLNEYQRRRYLSAEAKSFGRGGISLVSRLSGVSRQMLTEGIKELDNPGAIIPKQGKCRRAGGGRKPVCLRLLAKTGRVSRSSAQPSSSI